MTILVVAWLVGLAGFYAGHAHARWIMRDELQGLAKRIRINHTMTRRRRTDKPFSTLIRDARGRPLGLRLTDSGKPIYFSRQEPLTGRQRKPW